MQQVYEAAGMEAEANLIGDKIEAHIKDSPKIVDYTDEILASGTGERGNIMEGLGLDPEETNPDVIRGAISGASAKDKPAPKPADGSGSNDDGGSGAASRITSTPRPRPRPESDTVGTTPPAASRPTADTGGGMTSTTSDSGASSSDPRGEGQYGGQSTSQPSRPSRGGGAGRYEGGLMTKKKK